MRPLYKFFLVLFIVFLGINLYAFNWDLGVMASENAKFLFSAAASILGILLVLVLNTWSKIRA